MRLQLQAYVDDNQVERLEAERDAAVERADRAEMECIKLKLQLAEAQGQGQAKENEVVVIKTRYVTVRVWRPMYW